LIERALYSVETNLGFKHGIASLDQIPSIVIDSFRLPIPDKVKLIEKHNRFSSIFIIEKNAKKVVVRSSPVSLAKLLELQCQVFWDLPGKLGLKPLLNTNRNFVLHEEGCAWIAYPFVEGLLFDGDPDQVLQAFSRCLAITTQLRLTGCLLSAESLKLFPVVEFEPVKWKKTFDLLIGDLPKPLLIALGDDLHFFLKQNQSKLMALIDELSSWRLQKPSLVHYDLQHANIVMSSSDPTIIDLEDTYFAPVQIAVSYCAFKLSRHVLFRCRDKKEWVISKLMPNMLELLEPFGIESRRELFGYSAIRTINDIAYIFQLYYDREMEFVLYDLRKKVLNLLEVAELTSCSDRVGLR
jgi:hypothetical protein